MVFILDGNSEHVAHAQGTRSYLKMISTTVELEKHQNSQFIDLSQHLRMSKLTSTLCTSENPACMCLYKLQEHTEYNKY